MRLLTASCICVLAITALSGCGGGGGGGGGSARLQVFMTDAPIAADAINVKLRAVCVHGNVGWTTLKEYSDADPAINLMDYQAKNDFDDDPDTVSNLLVADSPLPPGHYTIVRLHIASMEVVIDGVPYPVDLTDVANGIKVDREFDVAKGDAAELLLDFNAKESIVQTGEGTYKLDPVMAVVPKSVAGTISGTMVFSDASQAAALVPDGHVEVGVFVAGTTKFVNSAQLNINVDRTSGTFTVGALMPGTYDIKVEATGYSPGAVRLAGVIVGAAEAKDVGEIVVALP